MLATMAMSEAAAAAHGDEAVGAVRNGTSLKRMRTSVGFAFISSKTRTATSAPQRLLDEAATSASSRPSSSRYGCVLCAVARRRIVPNSFHRNGARNVHWRGAVEG